MCVAGTDGRGLKAYVCEVEERGNYTEGMHVADIRATISILLIVGVHVGHVWDQGET